MVDEWETSNTVGGGGSSDTASNVGTAGTGVFKQKSSFDFQFKKLNAGSNRVSIVDDTTNSKIDINVTEANLTLGNIGGTVGTTRIADLAVTTAKINDLGVTNGKIADSAVCTSKIGDDCVTLPKLVNMTDKTLLGRAAGSSGDPQEIGVKGGLLLESSNLYIDHVLRASNKIGFVDDFFGDIAAGVTTGNLEQATSGTGSTIVAVAVAAAGLFGVWELRTGTTTTGRAALFAGNNVGAFLLGQGITQIETKLKITTLSDGTDTYKIVFGFTGAGDTATINDGVYFEYISTSSANWRMCTSNDGTRTQTNSSTAVAAGSWIKLKIVINAAGTSVDYLVNGTVIGTITTNIPLATDDPVSPIFGIFKSAGTTDRQVQSDYVAMDIKLTTPR